jgi:hypothetical protein
MSMLHRLCCLWLLLAPKNVAFAQFGEKVGHDWEQVAPNVAFQRNADLNSDKDQGALNEAMRRMLGGSSAYSDSPYSYSMQSTGTEYSSYQLAWRLLGFYIDCNYNGGSTCQRLVLYAVVRCQIQ